MDAGATSGDSGGADRAVRSRMPAVRRMRLIRGLDDCRDAPATSASRRSSSLRAGSCRSLPRSRAIPGATRSRCTRTRRIRAQRLQYQQGRRTEWLGEDEIESSTSAAPEAPWMFTLQLRAYSELRGCCRLFPHGRGPGADHLAWRIAWAHTVPTWRGTLPWRARWKTVTTA